MRTHGTLTKWNDDRGFGFITPAKDTGDLFVHISAFPRDGVRPSVNELISFEVEAGPDGRQRAVNVMRPGQRSRDRNVLPRKEESRLRKLVSSTLAIVVIAFFGYSAYDEFMRRSLARKPADPVSQIQRPSQSTQPSRPSDYRCDGRTMCSQMTSCKEATYFIRNCPGTQMDGDFDGVPCESQWCN